MRMGNIVMYSTFSVNLFQRKVFIVVTYLKNTYAKIIFFFDNNVFLYVQLSLKIRNLYDIFSIHMYFIFIFLIADSCHIEDLKILNYL